MGTAVLGIVACQLPTDYFKLLAAELKPLEGDAGRKNNPGVMLPAPAAPNIAPKRTGSVARCCQELTDHGGAVSQGHHAVGVILISGSGAEY